MLKGMSVAATTLGCKVNQAETDSMLDMLKAAGANIVEFDEKADIYSKYLFCDQYCGQKIKADASQSQKDES